MATVSSLKLAQPRQSEFDLAWAQYKMAQTRLRRFTQAFNQSLILYCEQLLPLEQDMLLEPSCDLVQQLLAILRQTHCPVAMRASSLTWLESLISNISRLDPKLGTHFRTQATLLAKTWAQAPSALLPNHYNETQTVHLKYDSELAGEHQASNIELPAWIQKLFRKTAQSLHPDREPDLQKRPKKHRLMTKLLQARQNKDEDRIIEFYLDYVANVEMLSSQELQQAIGLIHRRTRALYDMKDEIVIQTPTHALVYDWIYGVDDEQRRQNLNLCVHHFKEIQKSLRYCVTTIVDVESLKIFLDTP